MDLTAPAEAILRRNRGIQAAKDIRECKEDTLDLSDRGLGHEGAMELVEELKVWNYLLRTDIFNLLWAGSWDFFCLCLDKLVVHSQCFCAQASSIKVFAQGNTMAKCTLYLPGSSKIKNW